ncbi:MAG: cache domain-containing protein [Proteobacteria bacterium]|nr:cache domain-containing protein [Pseudomonadota bacterium]
MSNLITKTFIVLTTLSILTLTYFTIQAIEIQIKELIVKETQNKLITIRDNKKQQIENYLIGLHKRIQLYASNKNIIHAMRDLKQAFFQVEKPTKKQCNIISKYYSDFTNNNLSKLDDQTTIMQYHYIVNKNSKRLLPDKYHQLHKIYHNRIRQLQHDIEDILLVDTETGRVIYSINKNIDFAVSLLKKTPSNNSLSNIFQLVNLSNQTKIIDFTPYLPLHNTHVAFIGTPILLNKQKIGILILQINSEHINNIMTHNKKWQSEKSGDTGESYIVAIDGTMRNDSRKLIEYKEDYLLAIEQAGLPNNIVTKIKLKNTSIGLQIVNTLETKAITGLDLYIDYNDEFVFAAFTPLNIFGLQWTVFATIQENEVLETVTRFTDKITDTIIQITVIILIITNLILWLIIPTQPLIVPKGYTIKQIITHINKLK